MKTFLKCASVATFATTLFFVPDSSVSLAESLALDYSHNYIEKINVFILGDSQILFNGGATYVDQFSSLVERCAELLDDLGLSQHESSPIDRLGSSSVGVLAVRGASINSWVARAGAEKQRICTPQKTWPVNARGFGALEADGKPFFQIGTHPDYLFCKAGQSPLEVLLDKTAPKPDLFVIAMLGKRARLWSEDKALAEKDALRLAAQIPADMPCILMTTAPTFRARENGWRIIGQDLFFDALRENKTHCTLVRGYQRKTIFEFQSNKKYFKTGKNGKVRDAFHSNPKGQKVFLDMIKPDLCRAVSGALAQRRLSN